MTSDLDQYDMTYDLCHFYDILMTYSVDHSVLTYSVLTYFYSNLV